MTRNDEGPTTRRGTTRNDPGTTVAGPDAATGALLTGLRADLRAADYTVATLEGILGPVAAAALHREHAVPALDALHGRREAAAVLARTFVLGRPTTRAALDGALPGTGTDGAVRLGLVEAAGTHPDDPVRPLLDLRPYAVDDGPRSRDWWLLSDLGELATGGPLRTDHVLGVGGASATLARATVRRPVGTVLDLGTGCGVQALHASLHADHVTGTDISRRALWLAGLNLGLAGVGDRADLLHGDLLAPVAGREFDLVVSNPPFVITPRVAGVPVYEYRDGAGTGDDVVRHLVTTVGGVLAPGGTAQLLANWEVHGDDPWDARVRGWLEESGLDGWVVQRELQDPAEYAHLWIRDGGQRPGPDFDDLYRAWLRDLAGRDVTAVGFGLVTLRRPADPTGPRWHRVEEQRGPVTAPLGAHLARCLDALDLLARSDDDAVLARRWQVAADVTEERHHRPGEAEPAAIVLRQTDGFGRAVQVGTVVAAAVGACDGDLTLGQVAAALAVLLEVDAAAVAAEVVAGVRALAGDGFLTPGPS